MEWYGWRSLPQTEARTTRTTASVGACTVGSGSFSTRTSPAPYMTVARTNPCLPVEIDDRREGVAPAAPCPGCPPCNAGFGDEGEPACRGTDRAPSMAGGRDP